MQRILLWTCETVEMAQCVCVCVPPASDVLTSYQKQSICLLFTRWGGPLKKKKNKNVNNPTFSCKRLTTPPLVAAEGGER